MIDNLIHTVSKEVKPSQYGSLQTSNSKNGNGLEGEFKALFQSLKSEPENVEELHPDQHQLDESDETETKMDESSDAGKGSDIDSEALTNVEKEKSIDESSTDQNTESAQESSGSAKIIINDESITETELSRTKVEDDSTDMKEENVSESGEQVNLENRNPESNIERAEIEDLEKENTEPTTGRENNLSESALSLMDANSANGNTRSENPGVDPIHRESQSEMKESLSDSVLRVNRSSFDKTEEEGKVNTNVSRTASNVQTQNETGSTKESAEMISNGNDKPDQASHVENSISKQEPSSDYVEKGEPDVSKSESDKFQRFINVDEVSNTIRKSGEGLGVNFQSEGSSNEVMNPIESNEPRSNSEENELSNVKENSSSTELRSSEITTQRSQEGDSTRENIRSTEREVNRVQPFTSLNNSETGQNSDSAEKLVDRFIHENLDKPIRIAQKPVESTVLIQDKVQPKRERNDLFYLNNNELKESSRLTIPGIGADSAKQSTSFSSGQFSENFSNLDESEKNEILWKEHTSELAESDELNRSELSAAALSKLGDSTLSNHFLRRVLLPGLTQTVLTASGQSDRAENWQRHNFILEDGSKVQLSARKIDGVLQIKLGASIGELSKLLQIHQDEIREHLEKECNIKIDLQFDQGSGDQDQSSLEDFFGESPNKPAFNGGSEGGSQANKNVKKQLHAVVTRNFGYNSKEWTA